MRPKEVSIANLIFTKIEGMEKDSDYITFTEASGREFIMYHDQDCCERVALEEVIGDVSDLVDTPILSFSADSEGASEETVGNPYDTGTWTFYNFRTIKGSVTLRWLGTSNGYYSEIVDFKEQVGKSRWDYPDVENCSV